MECIRWQRTFIPSGNSGGSRRETSSIRSSNLDDLNHVLIAASSGAQIPIVGAVADLEMVQGPVMIRDENGVLSSYVYIDIADRDVEKNRSKASQLMKGYVENEIAAPEIIEFERRSPAAISR